MITFDTLIRLECGVQHYPWGERANDDRRPYIAELLGVESGEDIPFAELWMGTHPTLPSQAHVEGQDVLLAELIRRNPIETLGPALVQNQKLLDLPFLLKVLSCESPLSIQAHPDRALAAKLHATNPEQYPDANHKPEIAIALTGLTAFCRFRDPAAIRADIDRLDALQSFFRESMEQGRDETPRQWLKRLYARLFTASDEAVAAVIEGLVCELEEEGRLGTSDTSFRLVLGRFPGDRGALSAYFLNTVHLAPGESVFLGPNEPHAYLAGNIIECMANSNNVVRAGLTEKFVDGDVLLDMLSYETGAPDVSPGETVSAGTTLYRPPVQEFQVEAWQHDSGAKQRYGADGAVSLLVVTKGAARFGMKGKEFMAERGSVWLWPAAAGEVDVHFLDVGTQIFRARPNMQAIIKDMDVIEMPEDEAVLDFGALLDGQTGSLTADFEPGDKISGTVSAIDRASVFVDIGAKSEGIIDRQELLDDRGKLSVKVGDTVEAFYMGSAGGEIKLSCKMTGVAADSALMDAYEAGIPVEGRVSGERKGGFEVMVGQQQGFCPYSQIDIAKQDAALYIGERFSFAITEYTEDGNNLVLSRRHLLEEERRRLLDDLKTELQVGARVSGRVRRVMPFGAFVDIGGMDGLVPVSELSWGHVADPTEFISEGEDVEVLVREIDWERERISLSLKRAAGDPWDSIEGKFLVGGKYMGTVTKLMPFGAFVELEPGIEGLVHVSKLGAGVGRRISHPGEVIDSGDTVEVSVESIDFERRRISLTTEDTSGRSDDEQGEGASIAEGAELTGVVEGVQDFGVFVRLPDGRNGLVHISQIELTGSTNRRRAMFDMFPPGKEVQVVIREVKGDRISLTLPETLAKESETLDISQFKDSAGGELGSLGGIFDGLDL